MTVENVGEKTVKLKCFERPRPVSSLGRSLLGLSRDTGKKTVMTFFIDTATHCAQGPRSERFR